MEKHEHVETYYTSMETLARRYRETQRSCAFHADTLAEYESWKIRTRVELRAVIGLDKLESSPLNPILMETEELPHEPYRRLKYRIQTEQDVWMPFYLLEPKTDGVKSVMICPHGHGGGGKLATGGRIDIPAVKKVSDEQHYEYGIEFAKRGFLVFCPDARGFGERRERCKQGDMPEQYMTSSCRELNNMAIPLGLTVTGMWVFDLMRLIDYIETRPDCDHKKIGVGGLSGGGLQSMWLAALDDRICAATTSGYFYGYHDALLLLHENCSCNYVPHLWEKADMGDIAALIAPRPLVIETGDQDPLNGARGVENVTEQVEIVRKAYRLFDCEENCVHTVDSGKHRWYGSRSYDVMEQALKGL